MSHVASRLGFLAAVLLCSNGPAQADEAEQAEFFESKIRPVLVSHCYECHAADAKQLGGELLLDSKQGVSSGGESGSIIEPGDPDASLLMDAIRYEGLEMPPSGKLPDKVINDFSHWIKMGAHDPRDETPSLQPRRAPIDFEQGREFWAFQPPRRHTLPENVLQSTWPQRRIDYFALDRMREAGLTPAPPAETETLVRRLYFDLTGLPPTRGQLQHAIQRVEERGFNELIDALLASPRFGERWTRLWMDVARYAEDQAHIVGNNDSLFYPNAYLYRDWLLSSFNADLPYDEFAKLQLASDLIAPQTTEHEPALGFLGLGPKYYRRSAPEVMADEWEDRVDTVTRGFLGLTVACARCHDHKYDPIATEDYYALAGVFASTEMFNKPLGDVECDNKGQAKKAAESVHIVREGNAKDLPVYIRGDHTNQGAIVPRRYLRVLSPIDRPLDEGSGRAQLATLIASKDNPLTARVLVNRIWAEYFGNPLVGTTSNFGNLGERPTHPRLLDDLAVRFMESGWSMKWLHREIVTSATYQQASQSTAESHAADPANVWLSRMNRRRLRIEQWRDAILQITGNIDDQIGGTSFDVSKTESNRRTVYAHISRLELDGLLHLFDHPDPNVHAARRSETTTPLQKLFVLNSDFMIANAKRLATRLNQEIPDNLPARIARAFEVVFGRTATADEMVMAESFVADESNWTQFTQILLASNELLFLD